MSPRQLRACRALLSGPVNAMSLCIIAGVTNAPALIQALRRRGLSIPCTVKLKLNRDGQPCYPGEYSLTEQDRETVLTWFAK